MLLTLDARFNPLALQNSEQPQIVVPLNHARHL